MKNLFKMWIIANIECVALLGSIIFFGFQMSQHPQEAGTLITLCVVSAIPLSPSKNLTEICAKSIFFLPTALAVLFGMYKGEIISIFTLSFVLLLALGLTIWNAIYTYNNMDNVISRSMRYRYSGVDLLSYKFKFVLGRFIVVFTILLSVFTIFVVYFNKEEIIVKNKVHETLSIL